MKEKIIVLVLVVVGIPAGMVAGVLVGLQLRVQSGLGMAACALPFMASVGWIAARIGKKDADLAAHAHPIVGFGIPSGFALGVGALALRKGDLLWGTLILGLGMCLAIPLVIAVSTEKRNGASREL